MKNTQKILCADLVAGELRLEGKTKLRSLEVSYEPMWEENTFHTHLRKQKFV